jgi:transcription termination factor NusB
VKNKFDPRHLKRIANIQALFAWNFGSKKPQTEDTPKIIKLIPKIDEIIKTNAPKWPLEKINKVDLNILRYAFWELFYFKKNPEKVVIDEVIEIAKEYGTDSSSSFVNGVIGSALKNKEEENETKS